MGKNPGIRITENDRREYARLVKNTKAKVRNTVKKYGPIINDVQRVVRQDQSVELKLNTYDIRSKLSIPSLDSFKTRKDFNKWKEETQKFNSGKSPHGRFTKNKNGMVFTDYFQTVGINLEYKAERAQRIEREKTADIPIIRNGKKIGTIGEFAKLEKNPEVLGYKPFKFNLNDFFSPDQTRRWIEKGVAKGSGEDLKIRKQTMMDNWIEMIRWNYNSDADDLLKEIEALGPEGFYEFYISNVNSVVEKKWMSFFYLESPKKRAKGLKAGGKVQFVDASSDHLKSIEHALELYKEKKKKGEIYDHPHFE